MILQPFLKYAKGIILLNLPLSVHGLIYLVTLPIILGNIQAVDYGKWQFVLALQVWIFALSADNITRATKRGIARGRDGTFIYGFLARMKLAIPISILLVAVASYIFVAGDKSIALLLSILAGYVSFGYIFQVTCSEYLIAKKRFRSWSILQIIISATSLGGAALVAYLTKSIIFFALFHLGSVSFLSFCIWLFIVSRNHLLMEFQQGTIDTECVSYGIKLIPVELIGAAASKIAYFFIVPYFGYVNLALFSVADKLRERGVGFIRSVRPLLYADFAQKPQSKIIFSVNRNLLRMFFIGLLLALILLIIAWVYINAFLPIQFRVAFHYFVVLASGIPAVLMAVILHTSLEAHLRYKELTVIGVIPNLLKVLLVILGGYLGGIFGICIGLTTGVWISLVFYYMLTLRLEYVQRIVVKFPFLAKLSEY